MEMDITPIKQNLSKVFQINAITVDKDYFMLTHKPFKNIRIMSKELFLNGQKFFHEKELYQTILENRDKHQFFVVKGSNGSGKSHLIRWIKENYEQDADQEAVIFISRMQSTLKGALQQIIHSEVIQNHETATRLKKLIDANEHLDNDHLKNIIIAHFMVAVKEDDGSHEVTIKPNKRKNLQEFLSSEETSEFLLKENGPIDRIQKKLSSSVNNEIMNDVDPHFVPEDFFIAPAQAQELKKTDISTRALKMISDIMESGQEDVQEEVEEFRGQLASYLNQFLDKVVQECLHLRGTDLKEIFILLRQELKKEGKNLTLFIEDITSFTGVDKDLVEVLIADHLENESLCRLISIVGITNGYYNTSLPGNIKDRIGAHIEIDKVVIENEDECAELAARYINAVYLEDEQIREWKNNGYSLEEFPVATAFKQHEWANFKIDDDVELSIFPFTKTALWNFYSNLESKTPRNFLQSVLLQFIQKYNVDGPKGQFPPEIGKVIAEYNNVPNWKDSTTELVLKRVVPDYENERYQTLFRIWGNGTINKQLINGKDLVGGLEDDVFRAFGLEPIKGIQGNTGIVPKKPEGEQVKPKPVGETSKPKLVEKTEKPEAKQEQETPIVDPPLPEPPNNRELDVAISEIEKWGKGEPLSNTWMLDDFLQFIREYLHWDLEGIPALIVKDFISPNYVFIEGQIKNVRVKEEFALKFERSVLLRFALVALAQYKYLGKGSWSFDGSQMALLSLHTWIETEKENILSFLKKPNDYTGEDWKMEDYVVASEFYTTTLMNGFTGTEKKVEDIYLQLVKEKKDDKLHQHNPSWSSTANNLDLSHTDLFRRYFNELQGDVKKYASSTSTFFYDAFKIIETINRLKAQDFEVNLQEIPKGSSSWYFSVNILSKLQAEGRLTRALLEEVKDSQGVVEKFRSLFGDQLTIETIKQTVKEAKGMLDYLLEMKEPFIHGKFELLYQESLDFQQLVNRIQTLQSLAATDFSMEQFVILSNSPSLQLLPFSRVLEDFSALIDEKSAAMTKKIGTIKEELESQSENPLDEVLIDVNTVKEYLTELNERSVKDAVK